jgi:hypothetical protein
LPFKRAHDLPTKLVREMSFFSPRMCLLAAALLSATTACSFRFKGQIGPAEDENAGVGAGGAGVGPPQIPVVPECQNAPKQPGPSPVRRLTKAQYNNTVRDLLNDTSAPANQFPQEEIGLGFTNNAHTQAVSGLLIEEYEKAAAGLATRAVQNLPQLMGCNPAGGEDACMRSFLTSFGLRAWRRPLTREESDRLFAFYTKSKQGADFPTAVRMTVEVMLQSPHFIYMVESGGATVAGDVTRLTGYEMASRLSYLLWGTMPDTALFEAAAAGTLDTAAGVAEQAQRMLKDPRTNQAVGTFIHEWLDLAKLGKVDKDARLFPMFTPKIRELLRQETEMFTKSVMLEGGNLETLLLADYTFMNRELAAYYGLNGPSGEAFGKVALDTRKHLGLLTHAGLMASYAKVDQSSPVTRGVFVREHLLCSTPPPPPNNVMVAPPPPDPTLTTRERFARHRSDPTCAGCHAVMDPIGFGFEHFDAIGRWRDSEGTKPIDASGEINGTMDADGPFNGASELAMKLSKSAQVRGCMVSHWFRYAYGRGDSATEDKCALASLNAAFANANGDFRQLMIALTQTDVFLYRTKEAP